MIEVFLAELAKDCGSPEKKIVRVLISKRVRISEFDPPSACVFAWRVLELKEQGVSEDYAMAVAGIIILF